MTTKPWPKILDHYISVSEVRGYGEYADLNSSNWLVNHLRLELYVPTEQAEIIAKTIMQHAQTGMKSDGIVSIESIDNLWHVRDFRRGE